MFVDPKTGKATLKQSESTLLQNAISLLRQIGKFAEIKEATEAAEKIEAVGNKCG